MFRRPQAMFKRSLTIFSKDVNSRFHTAIFRSGPQIVPKDVYFMFGSQVISRRPQVMLRITKINVQKILSPVQKILSPI
jgi:hypothetical protein